MIGGACVPASGAGAFAVAAGGGAAAPADGRVQAAAAGTMTTVTNATIARRMNGSCPALMNRPQIIKARTGAGV
jgi:hypothetical protein